MVGRTNQGLSRQARLYITEATETRIEEVAERLGVTKSEVMRQALGSKIDAVALELLINDRFARLEAEVARHAEELRSVSEALAVIEATSLELAKLICFALPSPTDPERKKQIQAAGEVRLTAFKKQIQAARQRLGTQEQEEREA